MILCLEEAVEGEMSDSLGLAWAVAGTAMTNVRIDARFVSARYGGRSAIVSNWVRSFALRRSSSEADFVALYLRCGDFMLCTHR